MMWVGDTCYMEDGEWPKINATGRFVWPCWGGYERWLKDGKIHREGGPAVIHADGMKLWYLNGKQVFDK